MIENSGSQLDTARTLRIDADIETLEIQNSGPKVFRMILKDPNGQVKVYHLKITAKGGMTLV